MQSAPPTPDEAQRLRALYNYQVLDTEAEKVFDDLTQLASDICEAPIALISLVDPDRQWFKSKVGIDAEETSRDIAFCAHAIHERAVFEVPDTTKDRRFWDNPLVTSDPNIRFYAGAQLITPDDHAIGTLCVISDKPKKLTERQKSALELLSREVISQMELRLKVRELEIANRNKTEFLSHVSHELRTPLNAVINFSQIINEKLTAGEALEEIAIYSDRINFSGKRLLKVINTLLELNKIEMGKMDVHKTTIDTNLFFKKIIDMLLPSAQDKQQILQLQLADNLPEHLVTDDDKVTQVLINLINNAIKFTPEGKEITICSSISEEDSRWCIQVEDQGMGISHELQEKLFKPFQQFHSAIVKGGSGLGLSICKSLIELMQGTISVESDTNKGTRFTITLPFQKNTHKLETEITQSLKAHNNYSHFKILVVEDDLINQEVAKAIFNTLNCSISVCSSAEEAIETIQQQSFDVIFMDIQLPGMNGVDATQHLRTMGVTTPVIALTADIFQGKDQFTDFLMKPIEREKLITALDKL